MIDFLILKNRLIQNIKTLWRNKFLLLKIFKVYFNKFFLKKNFIRLVEIAIGYKCNASCKQCSCAYSLDRKRRRLTLNQLKRLIDDSIKLGAFQFNITGGEPLLYSNEVYELVKYIRKKRCYVHICTNAKLLSGRVLNHLKKLGVNSLEFGLDSAKEKIHDANRGKGFYKKVMEATKIAKNLGIEVIWNTIITHEKIKNGDLLDLVNLAKKRNVLLQITPPCVMGRWSKKREILLKNKEKIFFKKLLTYSHVRTDTFSRLLGIGCSAGIEKFAVNPYGDILPCSLIQVSYGNFLKEPLEKIQKKILKNPFYGRSRGVLSCLPSFNIKFINKYL